MTLHICSSALLRRSISLVKVINQVLWSHFVWNPCLLMIGKNWTYVIKNTRDRALIWIRREKGWWSLVSCPTWQALLLFVGSLSWSLCPVHIYMDWAYMYNVHSTAAYVQVDYHYHHLCCWWGKCSNRGQRKPKEEKGGCVWTMCEGGNTSRGRSNVIPSVSFLKLKRRILSLARNLLFSEKVLTRGLGGGGVCVCANGGIRGELSDLCIFVFHVID